MPDLPPLRAPHHPSWRASLLAGAVAIALAGPAAAAGEDGTAAPEGITSAQEIEGQLTRGLTIGEPATPAETAPAIDLNVQFEFNSDRLTPQARAQLDQLGTALKSAALRDDRFQIAGHTDASGSAAYNQALSQRRAAAVLQYLTTNADIDAARLSPIGYGESRLLDATDPNSAANRRVEITNLGH